MFTVGVEEEFLLFDPGGQVAPVAAEVVRRGEGRVEPRFMAYQVGTSTRPCARLAELRAELVRQRTVAREAAEQAGARLVSVGLPPFRTGPARQVRADRRCLELARRVPGAADAGGACACRVHVAIPDPQLRIQVLARIRSWLATLLVLSVNSPICDGVDTGWHSHRYRSQLHWPTFRPPAAWTRPERYEQAVRSLVKCGAALDRAGVYLLARLPARYPTIEVRVADAALTVDDALLLAASVRALAWALADDALRGRPITPASHARIRAGLLSAAQHGAYPPNQRRRDGGMPSLTATHSRLLAKIWQALEEFGDVAEVTSGLIRLSRRGTGADRQRAMWARAADPAGFVGQLADAVVPQRQPAYTARRDGRVG